MSLTMASRIPLICHTRGRLGRRTRYHRRYNMIYTCYEMVRDCRAGSSEGWAYFIAHYVPVIRKALAQYVPERASDPALLNQILEAARKPESFIFHATEQPEERWFVSQLRQLIVAELAAPAADLPIDLEIL